MQNGNWSNELPKFSLSQCDDSYLKNRINNSKTAVVIEPDRIQFCNIFNIIEQNVTITWSENKEELKKNFSITKGIYTHSELENVLNQFDERIKFKFNQKDKIKFKGQLTVCNSSMIYL